MDLDTEMSDADTGANHQADAVASRRPRHFVISIDFGTTFSSVAWVGYYDPRQRRRIGRQHVNLVERYPQSPYANVSCYVVPTELWYSQRIVRPIIRSRGASKQQHLLDEIDSDDSDHDGSDTETSSEATPEPDQLSANGDGEQQSLFWGYAVQDQLTEAVDDAELLRYLSRFKLILDKSEHTEKQRNILSDSCKTLKKMLLINEDTDIIADYLEQLFRHTKERLIDSEGYDDISTVEFVLCVPAIWDSEASRHMQVAMNAAISNSGLGKLQHGSIDNLFIVSEPEAAAAWILANEEKTRLKIGDTFILLDAGGGTVDAVTYTVDQDTPLRLKTEEVKPGGAMCGSSFINERFEDLLYKRLKDGRYVDLGSKKLSQIINGVVIEFERRDKKAMDAMFPDRVVSCTVKVPGLREKHKKRFKNGRMCLSGKEIRALFEPSLEGVAEVMKEQITLAKAKGCEAQKIILMGGFGQSKSLSSYLRAILQKDCGLAGQNIVLDSSNLLSSSVACGAILRALRKEDGPARILQSSYGFLRQEPYGTQEAHASQVPEKDKIDGFPYIYNTIDWIINKGDTLVSEHVVRRKVEYTFHISTSELLGTEYLYVSDRRHESHYQVGHPNNAGAVKHGFVDVDMTFLKDTGRIKLYSPREKGKLPYWKISGTLLIFVSGRNLRYEVRLDEGSEEFPIVGQTSIAAAFRPGTE